MSGWGKCHGEAESEAEEGGFRGSERWNFNQDGEQRLYQEACVHVIYLASKCIPRLHLFLFSSHINLLFSLFQFSISWSLTDWRRQAASEISPSFLVYLKFFFFKRTLATIKVKFRVLHKTINSQMEFVL